jgi:tight adherence protein B
MLANEMPYVLSVLLTGIAAGIGTYHFIPWCDRLIQKRISHLCDRLNQLEIDSSIIPWAMRLWFLLLITMPLVVFFVMKLGPIVLPVIFMIWNAPAWILEKWIAIRIRTYRDQMVPMCVSLANAARSGLSLPSGIDEITSEMQRPLRNVVARISQEYKCGRTIVDAIRDTQQRLQLDHFNVFTSVILTCFETGSNYTTALDKMSHTLMENQRLERKLMSDTASGRFVIFLLSLFPSIFLMLFYILSPDMVRLLIWDPAGQIGIVIAFALNYISVRIALRYLDLKL